MPLGHRLGSELWFGTLFVWFRIFENVRQSCVCGDLGGVEETCDGTCTRGGPPTSQSLHSAVLTNMSGLLSPVPPPPPPCAVLMAGALQSSNCGFQCHSISGFAPPPPISGVGLDCEPAARAMCGEGVPCRGPLGTMTLGFTGVRRDGTDRHVPLRTTGGAWGPGPAGGACRRDADGVDGSRRLSFAIRRSSALGASRVRTCDGAFWFGGRLTAAPGGVSTSWHAPGRPLWQRLLLEGGGGHALLEAFHCTVLRTSNFRPLFTRCCPPEVSRR